MHWGIIEEFRSELLKVGRVDRIFVLISFVFFYLCVAVTKNPEKSKLLFENPSKIQENLRIIHDNPDNPPIKPLIHR